jgi:outer membrane lipoprotein-sorting protein
VEFLVGLDFRIREVKVTAYDHSVLHFTFDQERLDPPLDAKLFQFQAPKGAELVEAGQ